MKTREEKMFSNIAMLLEMEEKRVIQTPFMTLLEQLTLKALTSEVNHVRFKKQLESSLTKVHQLKCQNEDLITKLKESENIIESVEKFLGQRVR